MTAEAPVDLIDDGLVRFEESPTPAAAPVDVPAVVPRSTETCARCKERPGVHQCFQCERWVCKDDHWTMLGLCKDCATPLDNRAARDPTRVRPDLGIKWIED